MYIPLRDPAPNASEVGEVWPQLELSEEQARLWDETRAAVLWALPFISDVWYAMMADEHGKYAYFTDQIPIAATDDRYMYLNPTKFFKYTLAQRVFICCHEVMHCIFNHSGILWRMSLDNEVRYADGTVLKLLPKLMNIAADYIVNAILIISGITGMPDGAWHNPKEFPSSMTVLDAYRKLYHPPIGGSGNGKDEEQYRIPDNGESFDEHLRPGKGRGESANEAEGKRDQQKWNNAINAAIDSGQLAGNMPAEMERLFKGVMVTPPDWTEYYELAVTKALGRDRLSWMYLDPEYAIRGIGFPGKIKFGCELAIVIDDTSGSINQPTTDYFLGITQGTIELLNPKRLIFCECDWEIHRWDDIEDISDLKGKVRGGGGTSFVPPFERIEKEGLDPDIVIYLTDLEGDAPVKEPPYPVVWACITKAKGPWGYTVHIPVKQALR